MTVIVEETGPRYKSIEELTLSEVLQELYRLADMYYRSGKTIPVLHVSPPECDIEACEFCDKVFSYLRDYVYLWAKDKPIRYLDLRQLTQVLPPEVTRLFVEEQFAPLVYIRVPVPYEVLEVVHACINELLVLDMLYGNAVVVTPWLERFMRLLGPDYILCTSIDALVKLLRHITSRIANLKRRIKPF